MARHWARLGVRWLACVGKFYRRGRRHGFGRVMAAHVDPGNGGPAGDEQPHYRILSRVVVPDPRPLRPLRNLRPTSHLLVLPLFFSWCVKFFALVRRSLARYTPSPTGASSSANRR